MRKALNDTPMTDWTATQLNNIINSKRTPSELKTRASEILTERKDKGYKFICDFFSTKNKFWTLAKWQLYREGKAQIYYDGNKPKFTVDDTSLVFDKMVEVHRSFMKQKKETPTDEVVEVSGWKR